MVRLVGVLGRQEFGRVDAVFVEQTHREMFVDRKETLLYSRIRSMSEKALCCSGTRTEQVQGTDHDS